MINDPRIFLYHIMSVRYVLRAETGACRRCIRSITPFSYSLSVQRANMQVSYGVVRDESATRWRSLWQCCCPAVSLCSSRFCRLIAPPELQPCDSTLSHVTSMAAQKSKQKYYHRTQNKIDKKCKRNVGNVPWDNFSIKLTPITDTVILIQIFDWLRN